MSTAKNPSATEDLVAQRRPEPTRLTELPALFHEMLQSIEHYSSKASQVIYKELEGLSHFIADANKEIIAIRPKEICDLHLPGAADELDAVVGHTEQATNTIFAAVEAIEGALADMPEETAAKVTDAVTQIYEACSFQDITGQRIAKVMRAMQEVQRRVGGLLVAFGDSQEEVRPGSVAAAAGHVSGPQLPQRASSQADIDALLNGAAPAGSEASQGDVDAMFAAAPAKPGKQEGQADIDAMFAAPAAKPAKAESQADIDAMFAAAAPKPATPANGALHRVDGNVALHGPQLPKNAPNQADIDALLNSLG
jgi:chemotaxis protein CheZ